MQKQIQLDKHRLDGLLGHFCASNGLYSKATFLSLYGCVSRLIRDHRLSGLAMTRLCGDDSFTHLGSAIQACHGIEMQWLDPEPADHPLAPEALLSQVAPPVFLQNSGLSDSTGFLAVVCERFSTFLYWTSETQQAFNLYKGGWTFNPVDTRVLVSHVAEHLSDADSQKSILKKLQKIPIDRRYDEKLTLLTTSLVNGLEDQNRELTLLLNQVQQMNAKVLENERLAAIGQLSATLAHEIRNPLSLIDLYAKLIESILEKNDDSPPSAQQLVSIRDNLGQIRQGVGGLEGILTELMDYSRPLTLERTESSLTEWLREVCKFVAPGFVDKNLCLRLEEPLPEIWVAFDAARLRQALLNILKNALEVAPEQSEVLVQLASRQGDEQVFIKVTDHGGGVSPAQQGRLFTPYFTTKSKGTGLGLAHSQKILQAHGGSVQLLSSSKKGSTFALILPRHSMEHEDAR